MSGVSMGETIKPKSDQINADDCLAGPLTGEILKVFGTGSAEQPVAIQLSCHAQPWKPSKSMRRVLVFVYGDQGDDYVGKSVTIFRNPTIAFGGIVVGGIEISHMSGLASAITIPVTVSRGKKKPVTIHPLVVAPPEKPPAKGKKPDAAPEMTPEQAAFNAWAKPLIADKTLTAELVRATVQTHKGDYAAAKAALLDVTAAVFDSYSARIALTAGTQPLQAAIWDDIRSSVTAKELTDDDAARLHDLMDAKLKGAT